MLGGLAPTSMETLALPDLQSLALDQLDGSRLLDLKASPVSSIREGLPTEAFDRLLAFLGCSSSTLADVLGIAPRTLARRRQAARLSPEESDRLLRTAHLAELALAVFEDAMVAAEWLSTPKRILNGETPLGHADTTPGAHEVADMLFAIEFSAAA